MTAEQMAALTLADIEAIAERYSGAVKTIREATSLLGGGVLGPVAIAAPPPQNNFNASEVAERQRLLSQIRGEDLPDDIRRAEGL